MAIKEPRKTSNKVFQKKNIDVRLKISSGSNGNFKHTFTSGKAYQRAGVPFSWADPRYSDYASLNEQKPK